jgi:serine phosphatase RsbU (regulator of sigma subunit)
MKKNDALTSPEYIIKDFRSKLAAEPDLKKRSEQIIDFAIIYGDTFGDEIIELIQEGVDISRKINFTAGEVIGSFNLAFFSTMRRGVSSVQDVLSTIGDPGLLIEKIKDDEEWYGLGLNLLSYFYWFKGEYDKGFDTVFAAIRHSERTQNTKTLAWVYYAVAVFYFDTKDFDNSYIHHKKAFDLFEKVNFKYGKGRAANGMASVDIVRNNREEALKLLGLAEKIYREMAQHSGLSRTLNDLGLLEKSDKRYDKAIAYLSESAEIRRQIGHLQGLTTSLTELAEIYLILGDYDKTLAHLTEALKWAKEIDSRQKEMRLHQLMYETCKKLGKTTEALDHFEKFYELKSSLLSDESNNKIKKLQTAFEKENAEKIAGIERVKNIELKKAYEVIEQKNKDIHDSINYAKRIQLAILAPEKEISRYFPENFLLYKPKDVVAGDFYFFEHTPTHLFYAAADCTGHGVPGALVSVICANALSRCVKEFGIYNPGKILDKARELVLETFQKSEMDVKDGMDISLLVKDLDKNEYTWAGANNPLWYFSDGKMNEIPADKQAIGFTENKKNFTTHTLNVDKNDMLFLFTDGYADQFGGPKGKKFKYEQLKNLLVNNAGSACDVQKNELEEIFNSWKGTLEQVDDVCVIGVRV